MKINFQICQKLIEFIEDIMPPTFSLNGFSIRCDYHKPYTMQGNDIAGILRHNANFDCKICILC